MGEMTVVLAALVVGLMVQAVSGQTSSVTQPVAIIFDTDMDSDCDDAGALAVLHALADRGECRILATTVSSQNEWSGPCVDAINTYYGRGDLPIGAALGDGATNPSKYAQQVAEAFPHTLKRTGDAADAARLWRRLLMNEPDGSVTIVTVGYLTNVADLLKLPPGDDLPAGADVAAAKVRQWVCMGGNFVGRPAHDDLKLSNNNFTVEPRGAAYAVEHWPASVPLVFVGREIGSVPSGLKVGANLARTPESNPVRMAYQHYFGGEPKDRHVADLTTVLYAVRGLRDYWAIEDTGWMDLHEDLTFDWRYDAGRGQGQAYLLKRDDPDGRPNDRRIERVLDELLLQPPRAGRDANEP